MPLLESGPEGSARAALARSRCAPAAAEAKIIELGQDRRRSRRRAAPASRAWPSRARPATRPRSAPRSRCSSRPRPARSSPGRSRSARRRRSRSTSSTTRSAGPPSAGITVMRPGAQALRARHRPEPDRAAGALPRRDRAVPAGPRAERQEGLRRGPDRARRGRRRWPSASATTRPGAPAAPRASATRPRRRRRRRQPGAITRFRCLYRTARLTYSVTLITEPKPPAKPSSPSRRRAEGLGVAAGDGGEVGERLEQCAGRRG